MSERSALHRIRHHDLGPGQVVIAGCLGTFTVTALSLWLAETLAWPFAVGFIALCATLPLAATRRALLTSVVLPPILMAAVATVIAVWFHDALDITGLSDSAGTLQRTIATVAHQGSTLGIACFVALLSAGLRLAGLKNTAEDEPQS